MRKQYVEAICRIAMLADQAIKKVTAYSQKRQLREIHHALTCCTMHKPVDAQGLP